MLRNRHPFPTIQREVVGFSRPLYTEKPSHPTVAQEISLRRKRQQERQASKAKARMWLRTRRRTSPPSFAPSPIFPVSASRCEPHVCLTITFNYKKINKRDLKL
jgi:hypothetical protein